MTASVKWCVAVATTEPAINSWVDATGGSPPTTGGIFFHSNPLSNSGTPGGTPDTTDPLVLGTTLRYSYSAFKMAICRVDGTDVGAYTQLSNLKFLLDAAYATGIKAAYKFSATYVDPTASNPPAQSASDNLAGLGYTVMPTTATTWSNAAATLTPSGSTKQRWGDFVQLIIQLDATTIAGPGTVAASGGTYAARRFTIQYDEIS